MIKVAIVDDHTLFRGGFITLLRDLGEIEVVLEARNGVDFQEKLELCEKVDVVIMDIRMPVMDGYATTLWVCQHRPELPVLALTTYGDTDAAVGMVKAGACGYLTKSSHPKEILQAIKMILEKGYYAKELVPLNLDMHEFSPPELAYIKLCSLELKCDEMAHYMNVSVKTLENYRDSVRRKIGAISRVGVVNFAFRNGLVS